MKNNLHELKLLNTQFYNLIRRLRKNNFNQTAEIACLAYEELLREINLFFNRKIN